VAMTFYVERLRAVARAAGGALVLVPEAAFGGLVARREITRPPGVGGLAANYRRRIVYLCRALYKGRHLVADLAHEMWHVFGSPIPPTKCEDVKYYWSNAWELALLKRIGAPLTFWQSRWGESEGGPGVELLAAGWPRMPPGKLRDVPVRQFLVWANRMMRAGATRGYFYDGGSVGYSKGFEFGVVDVEGCPVMLRGRAACGYGFLVEGAA